MSILFIHVNITKLIRHVNIEEQQKLQTDSVRYN